MRPLDRLYHLAEAENLPSIRRHGLLSAEALIGMLPLSAPQRLAMLRGHRPDHLRLSADVVIRDQKPMPPSALARALDDGLEPSDWYALLNRHVFLWPERERMERHLGACGGRPQILLTFDAAALFERFGDQAFLSPINSGNARRAAARRGLATLLPYETWRLQGWPTGSRTRPPAEVLFRCPIPVEAPYLVEIAEV